MTDLFYILLATALATELQCRLQCVLNVQIPKRNNRIHTADGAHVARIFAFRIVMHPFDAQREAGQQEIMMYVQTSFFLIIHCKCEDQFFNSTFDNRTRNIGWWLIAYRKLPVKRHHRQRVPPTPDCLSA